MPPPTANQIKSQLKTLLTPVIGTSGTKKVKIIEYLALAFKPGELEDPTILRSPLDDVTLADGSSTKRVNCLMITEEGFTQRKPKTDSVRTETRARGKNTITRRFRLTYFYQFGLASETTFSDNVELIRTTINANPKLGFTVYGAGGIAGPAQFINDREEEDELQMPVMIPDAFGDTIVHVADGFLTVRLDEPLG